MRRVMDARSKFRVESIFMSNPRIMRDIGESLTPGNMLEERFDKLIVSK